MNWTAYVPVGYRVGRHPWLNICIYNTHETHNGRQRNMRYSSKSECIAFIHTSMLCEIGTCTVHDFNGKVFTKFSSKERCDLHVFYPLLNADGTKCDMGRYIRRIYLQATHLSLGPQCRFIARSHVTRQSPIRPSIIKASARYTKAPINDNHVETHVMAFDSGDESYLDRAYSGGDFAKF